MFNRDTSFARSIVAIFAALFVLVAEIINIVFTFSFGYDVIGGFLLGSVFGEDAAAAMSGIAAVVLLDGGFIVGIMSLIWIAETVPQRVTIVLQTAFCFFGSIGASVVGIILLSSLRDIMPEVVISGTQLLGSGLIIMAFVVSSLATVATILLNPSIQDIIANGQHEADINRLQRDFHMITGKQSLEEAYTKLLADVAATSTNKAQRVHTQITGQSSQEGRAVNVSPVIYADGESPLAWQVNEDSNGKTTNNDLWESSDRPN